MPTRTPPPINKTGKWYEIKNEAGAGAAEIFIYDVIGEDWYGGGITAQNFCQELMALKGQDLIVHINSVGGSVFDGIVIHNALLNHTGNVETRIEGLAASIASIIALAGNKVVICDNAYFMIHDPFAATCDTADGMRAMADFLDAQKANLVAIYEKHSNLSADAISQAMTQETWYSAQEALVAGFADEVSTGKNPMASAALSNFADIFNKLPDALKNELCACKVNAKAENTETVKLVLDSTEFEASLAKVRKQLEEASHLSAQVFDKKPPQDKAWWIHLAQKRMDLMK